MSFDCVTPTNPLIARGIIPVLDSLQLCVSCNHRFLFSIHLVLQCLWLRTETPLISNMISCDLLPVNSAIEDMVDTKRQILGRVRLVFEKHQWVFWDPFYLLNPRTERLDLGRVVGCFCTANSAFAFEQRYSLSERIVCACDKVTKTVESGSSTEDEPAPTSFEGLPVRLWLAGGVLLRWNRPEDP